MTSETIHRTRVITLGGAGMICAIYGVFAIATGQPNPMPVWVVGGAGLLAAVAIWIAAWVAGPRSAGQAFDEGYLADERRAQGIGFWVAVLLYPVFGVLLWMGWVSWPVAFAAMGAFTVASFMLCLVAFDLGGRR